MGKMSKDTERCEGMCENYRPPAEPRAAPSLPSKKVSVSATQKTPSAGKGPLPAQAYYPVLLLLAALSLWMRHGFPVWARADASHDDRLFIRLAGYLASGAWLGPFNNLTLVKGMFYPLFIAAAHSCSVPLKLAEQAVYLAASAAAAGVVRKHAASNRLALLLFACLAFNPVLWHPDLARVLREGLYVSLSLAVVIIATTIAFPADHKPPPRLAWRVLQGFALGLLAAAFYLTREEGIWLMPALAMVVAAAIAKALWGAVLPSRRSYINAVVTPLLIAAAVFPVADCLVAVLNHRHYGIFETNELRSRSFLRAYGAITRIQEGEWRPYILFPQDARLRAYEISPAAQELAPSLEGNLADAWRRASCLSMNRTDCPEVFSGWLMWEVRDAVRDAGHYRSAPEAMLFYDTLADQINDACDHGRLACLPFKATLSPRFRREYVSQSLESAQLVAQKLFAFGDGRIGSAPAVGPPQGVAIFAQTVGGVYPATSFAQPVQVSIASKVTRAYALAFPIFSALGAAGLLLTISLRRLRPFPIALVALALASAFAVLSRIALLAYIEATSFPAATVLYISPASPFVIILAAVGIYLGYLTVFDAHR